VVFNPLKPKRRSAFFNKVLPSCRRRSAEVEEVLHGHLLPAGFWRHEFAPSPGNEKGFFLPRLNFFTASLPSGEEHDLLRRKARAAERG
jgi:hypothetical protein